ncbi:HTH arsR-type domain-containing protein [Sandaracinus amylolyticus]|nr:HTH arsR-type domain-containing protein [Sandaracinus amylolyticus]
MRATFRSGLHHEVLARAWDAPEATFEPDDAPCVVGSLALLGRIDEALALADDVRADPEATDAIVAEAQFFAIVGLCHAGRYADAESRARSNLRYAGASDPKTRFFVFQGIALFRYFVGRIGRARLASRRALREAVRARFQYGRLLALDLRGHVLVQRGEVNAGLRVLDQAEKLAAALGFEGHRVSIECARLAYENRHGRREADVESALTQVAIASVGNVYALRSAWVELAFRGALSGDAERGREALERAAEHTIPESDHRGRARFAMTLALLARLDRSLDEARDALDDARRALESGHDRILLAELIAWDRVLGTALFAPDRARSESLARLTEGFVARALEAMDGGRALGSTAASESPLWSLLAGDASPAARIAIALRRGWLGLVPLLVPHAREPGRDLVFASDSLVAADHGTVVHITKLPGHARELLAALSAGERTKEALINEVWRVARYSPQHHDAVIHTAIARLRRTLGPLADWIRTTPLGYALQSGVRVVHLDAETPIAGTPSEPEPEPEERDPILALLAERPLRSSELAERLRVSEATALRRLRALVATGAITRDGTGKRTRYVLAAD